MGFERYYSTFELASNRNGAGLKMSASQIARRLAYDKDLFNAYVKRISPEASATDRGYMNVAGSVLSEIVWHRLLGPYCKLYGPSLVMIENTKSCIKLSDAAYPESCVGKIPGGRTATCIALRLMAGSRIDSAMVGAIEKPGEDTILSVFYNKRDESGGISHQMFSVFINPSETLDGAMKLLDQKGNDDLAFCIKAFLMFGLIDRDSPDSIIKPDVLNKDREKFSRTLDPKYIEKAARRGVVGFSFGEGLEISPHFRRPHMAIRWCEKGHSVPRLVPVKGCLVNRQKVTVPEGFQDLEEANNGGD